MLWIARFSRFGLFHQPKPIHNRLGGKFPCLKCIGSPSRTRTSSVAVSSGGRISRKEDDNVITVVYCVALLLSVIGKKRAGKLARKDVVWQREIELSETGPTDSGAVDTG